MKKRERVKCGEAWAVRLNGAENPRWVAGDWCGVANERVTHCRDGRWLFRTRERALTVAGQAEREVTWCETATVVRVTFYEVRRGEECGRQWRPVGDGAFAPPFGTIRVCRKCGCLVAGGPTACARCAEAGA